VQADGKPLDNVVLEIWQADAQGRFDNPDFFGWGRAATDQTGVYRFRTVKPGSCPGRAPHVNFLVLYSGLMRALHTTMFLDASPDPVLEAVPADRREKLIARREGTVYRFDIRLRGEGETPFFDD
jgi:protocatechuate 3,4-dioxygenase alpha subunit